MQKEKGKGILGKLGRGKNKDGFVSIGKKISARFAQY